MEASKSLSGLLSKIFPARSQRKPNRAWFWFLLPSALIMLIFYFLPVVLTVLISLTNMSTITGLDRWSWVGLENYRRILGYPDTIRKFWLTLRYVLFTLVFFNVGMALVISLITTHIPKKAGAFFRAVWLLPRITPVVVYAFMWQIMAAAPPHGIITSMILAPLGGSTTNLIPQHPFLFIVLMNGFVGASFGMIIFTSAIESIRKDIMVSSLVDGASILQRIRYIILPQLKWPMLFVTTYQTLSLLTSYEHILVLTGGNFNTEVWALWSFNLALNSYYGNFQYAMGAAITTMLVVVGLVFSLVYMRYFRFDDLVQEPKIDVL
ncbi:carbohydrate ABC transporter membrane protein 1, CUT1 family [Alkalispirochaeta americana]|uniref:Carbohydrate ABC transporter membrane protein 1, CUT1 family n=2 Tax=Alkalispirochaeta americana TaxID=159291 RepID=A0A1N6XNJ5_9SPIO|nr:carbohydrate ABC transporter membrane protein 1, CUT1 family [Alkalispirochaeta americana]